MQRLRVDGGLHTGSAKPVACPTSNHWLLYCYTAGFVALFMKKYRTSCIIPGLYLIFNGDKMNGRVADKGL